jgi:hypothetical protein
LSKSHGWNKFLCAINRSLNAFSQIKRSKALLFFFLLSTLVYFAHLSLSVVIWSPFLHDEFSALCGVRHVTVKIALFFIGDVSPAKSFSAVAVVVSRICSFGADLSPSDDELGANLISAIL